MMILRLILKVGRDYRCLDRRRKTTSVQHEPFFLVMDHTSTYATVSHGMVKLYSVENVIKRHENKELKSSLYQIVIRDVNALFRPFVQFMLEYRVLLHSGPLDFLQNAIDGLSSLRPSITMWSLLRLR